MVYTIEKEPLNEKRYYWRVDASYVEIKKNFNLFSQLLYFYRSITMYLNEATNKFSREIALDKVILQLNTNQDKLHYFEIRTDQNIYYCGFKRTKTRVK